MHIYIHYTFWCLTNKRLIFPLQKFITLTKHMKVIYQTQQEKKRKEKKKKNE